MRRFDGLNVVGSSPERFARPDAERPFSAASVSSARQISSCFMTASFCGRWRQQAVRCAQGQVERQRVDGPALRESGNGLLV